MLAIFAEGVTDPASWGAAAQHLGPDRGVVIVVLAFCATAIVLWRGSKIFGIPGVGTDILGEAKAATTAFVKVGVVMDRVSDVLDRLERSGRLPPPSEPPPPSRALVATQPPPVAAPTAPR